MQLRWVAALLALPSLAHADGELTLRGAYYKEKATRVQQPMLDARFDVGDDGEATAHMLVDSITSASAAAGAAGIAFNEKRYEVGAGYAHRLGDYRIGGAGRFSDESDYTSVFVSMRGEAELARKNTVLTLTLAQGRDHVTNGINPGGLAVPVEGDLDTSLGSLGVSQVLSPVLVGAITYDLIYLHGFLENPYRSVAAGGVAESERVPDTRLRHAVAGNLRGYYCPTRSTLVGAYRFYLDDWGIAAHTPEVRLIQEISPGLDVRIGYRYYSQSAAEFFKPVYDSNDPAIEPYLTDDPKLDAFSTQTFGLQVAGALSVLGFSGATGRIRLDASFEYVSQTSRFGDAVMAGAALTVPLEY